MQSVSLEKPCTPIFTRVISDTPGRIRLRIAPPYRQLQQMQQVANVLKADSRIDQVRTNIQNGSITIRHHGNFSVEEASTKLKDLGIVFGDYHRRKSEVAHNLTSAVFGFNKQVEQVTQGAVDLRLLVPLGFSMVALRQLIVKGLEFDAIPWYVMAWYAFDSFIKLHYTTDDQVVTHDSY